jgi:hypothetical protein
VNSKIHVEQLLRWRLARAEAEAPPAPRAVRLLELARPWWEIWPERFQSLVERVGRIQVAYGPAMADSRQPRSGHPVPVLLVHASEELETSARVLHLDVHEQRLHLRLHLDTTLAEQPETFEVTFVSADDAHAQLSAYAGLSVDNEYRIDTELSEELARSWELLKVTDRMPFLLILRSNEGGG